MQISLLEIYEILAVRDRLQFLLLILNLGFLMISGGIAIN